MRWKTFAIACGLVVALFLFGQRHQEQPQPAHFAAVIDLTHPVSEKFPNWEGTEKSPFEARQLGRVEQDGYFSRHISLPEHFATHVDAPAHFAAGRWTVDQIPPERLVAPLVVLDVSPKVRPNPDYQVTLDDVALWEQAHGDISPGAVVLARTGWGKRARSMKDYRNADQKNVPHFPGFLPETAQYLVESRKIVALGIDTLSVDHGPSKNYPVHRYTAARSVYHIENVANLELAPEAGALIVVAPAKLEGGSGGPARVFALVPRDIVR